MKRSRDTDRLEFLANLLDGFDDQAAAEARQQAQDIRDGLRKPAPTLITFQ